jgi:hypothetical protein
MVGASGMASAPATARCAVCEGMTVGDLAEEAPGVEYIASISAA